MSGARSAPRDDEGDLLLASGIRRMRPFHDALRYRHGPQRLEAEVVIERLARIRSTPQPV